LAQVVRKRRGPDWLPVGDLAPNAEEPGIAPVRAHTGTVRTEQFAF